MSNTPSKPEPDDQITPSEQGKALSHGYEGETTSDVGPELFALIRSLSRAGGVPMALTETPPPVIDTGELLSEEPAVTVAFPPCAGELLALIKTTGVNDKDKDDITVYFDEYFKFGRKHVILVDDPSQELDRDLLTCLNPTEVFLAKDAQRSRTFVNYSGWPSECCLCSPCLTLDGNRNALQPLLPNQQTSTGREPVVPKIRRLFVGDLVWLFHFEWMGIFQILGVILDAYASNGSLAISNGSIDAGVRDDLVAVILEVMVRQTKMGTSSSTRDRGGSYRTALGWTSEIARKLNLDTNINSGFATNFSEFVFHASQFYTDKRMAVAIRGAAAPIAPPSMATLITISNTLDLLKKRFELFDYGRNYNNTLAGIVWAIAGMSVIRELRTTLGIPPAFESPHEYIPAAYDLLVLKRPATSGGTNRYVLHQECARNARDILLDIQVIKHRDNRPKGELENWLTQIESKVEAYRTAYRTLTGIDLGVSGTRMNQQV